MVADDPHTLLLPNDLPKSYLSDKWISILLGITAFGAVSMRTYNAGKPFYAGIQRHIGVSIIAMAAGKFISDRRDQYLADKDAMLRHYISLHPEDFPTPERKLVKDLFKPWHPCR